MNPRYRLHYWLTIGLLVFFSQLSGQQDPSNNPNYGADSLSRVNCGNNLSTVAEYMKINLPDYALPAWRDVFENCPAASKNIYIHGVKIFQEKIEKTKDPVLQSAYFDTLMLIYDRRIQYFGEEGQVLGRKGKDILRYRSQDYEKAYETLKQSVEKSGSEIDAGVSVGLIETGVLMFKEGKITAKELLGNYIQVSENIELQYKKRGNAELSEQVLTRINAALGKAGLSNCQEIEEAFREKVSSGDSKTLALISDLLEMSNCNNAPFYGIVNENLFNLEPTADRAFNLARYNIRKERYDDAINYLTKAIESETDANKKAQYYYQMSILCNAKLNRQQDAVDYAGKAVTLMPGWGEPYFIIANAYILGSKVCFEGAFERSTVYWVATDYCIKAKNQDKSVEQKANSLISEYSRFYPNNEEVFFRSMKEGDEYTVGCWINEKTVARVRK